VVWLRKGDDVIHQLIFTNPKPGMSDEAFGDYWVNVHAVRFAGKIPQIRLYKVDTRIAIDGLTQPAPFTGVAEIWLKDEKEQLESMQSKELIDGARADEPNWAAFWTTIGLDTTANLVFAGPPETRESAGVKLITLLKRKPGMALDDFRAYSVETHGPLVRQLPGLRRYLVGHVRDSFYAVGEARFDAVTQMWFDDARAVAAALASSVMAETVRPDLIRFTEPKYTFSMVVQEHWIIGPEPRAYP
jgi:uncharacterized protein (TIGR02118 family)